MLNQVLSKRLDMEATESSDSAFLDLATNLLAVILIVTLFALIGASSHSNTGAYPLAQMHSEPRFNEPRRALFPPFSDFYFVLADHILLWDQDAVLDDLAQRSAARAGHTWQGRYEWQPDHLITRDIDGFRLRFFLNPNALEQQAAAKQTPVFARHDTDLLLNTLMQAREQHRAPVFLVLPEGMDLFAALYPALHERGVRFRWFAQNPEQPLLIGRDPAQFTHHVSYW